MTFITSRLIELNDLCRTPPSVGGQWFVTPGIAALPPEDQSAIREKVELYNDFTPDNDPYGEHDFGSFRHNGEKIFWKIDYYHPALDVGSEHPSDPKQTRRIRTIMLAEEYYTNPLGK
jgi:hypothetical protein